MGLLLKLAKGRFNPIGHFRSQLANCSVSAHAHQGPDMRARPPSPIASLLRSRLPPIQYSPYGAANQGTMIVDLSKRTRLFSRLDVRPAMLTSSSRAVAYGENCRPGGGRWSQHRCSRQESIGVAFFQQQWQSCSFFFTNPGETFQNLWHRGTVGLGDQLGTGAVAH